MPPPFIIAHFIIAHYGSARPRIHEGMHKLQNFATLFNITCYSNSEGTILLEITNMDYSVNDGI